MSISFLSSIPELVPAVLPAISEIAQATSNTFQSLLGGKDQASASAEAGAVRHGLFEGNQLLTSAHGHRLQQQALHKHFQERLDQFAKALKKTLSEAGISAENFRLGATGWGTVKVQGHDQSPQIESLIAEHPELAATFNYLSSIYPLTRGDEAGQASTSIGDFRLRFEDHQLRVDA